MMLQVCGDDLAVKDSVLCSDGGTQPHPRPAPPKPTEPDKKSPEPPKPDRPAVRFTTSGCA